MHKFVLGTFALAVTPLVAAGLWEALILFRKFALSPRDEPALPPSPSTYSQADSRW